MVPSSSAQREPSMEEILASIRRIIEDNDAGRKQPPEADAGDSDEAAYERNVIEVDAFRNELRAPSPETPAAPVPNEAVAPEGDAVAEPDASDDEEPAKAATSQPATPPAWNLEKSPAKDRSAAEERIRMAIENARARSEELKRRSDDEQDNLHQTANDDRATTSSPLKAEAEDDGMAFEEPAQTPNVASGKSGALETVQPRPAFLSEQAERKIAASFGELSEAFAARSQKTFDDMAEEMLQPMLRDWLDNNLPVLVERLVREEIERVARGCNKAFPHTAEHAAPPSGGVCNSALRHPPAVVDLPRPFGFTPDRRQSGQRGPHSHA